MKEQKMAIIWRGSTYESGRCNECGLRVMTGNGQPRRCLEKSINGRTWLLCERCENPLAWIVKDYNGPGEPGERMGRWRG